MLQRMLTVAVMSCAVAGCASHGWSGPELHDRAVSAGVSVRPGAPLSLDVEEGNGAIKVERDDALGEAKIAVVLRSPDQERVERATLVSEVTDGVLRVRVEWPGGRRKDMESASLTITGPAFDGLTLKTGNGEITIADQSGPTKLTSGNGRVVARTHRGDIEIRTGNGDIEAQEVAGRVAAESGNGSVRILSAGNSVTARSGNGGVEVELAASSPGPVTASSGMGDVSVTLGRSFEGRIDGSSGMGSARVVGSGPSARVLSRGDRAFSVEVGSGGGASKLSTSMGSVRLTLAQPNG